MRNTIAIKVRLDGIGVWEKDIRRYTESGFVKAFPSGCRRFIAVTLTGSIRLPNHIDYEQLYAQAVVELDSDRRYWFDEADTQEIMANNQHYQQRTPAEALFLDCFSIPKDLTKGAYMTAASIFSLLRQRYGSQLNLTSLSHFGRVLANIPTSTASILRMVQSIWWRHVVALASLSLPS